MFQGIAQAGAEGTSTALGTYAGYRIGAKADKKAFERQIWMARNAHQLEVADLRDAGLNPILSATGGHGASYPSAPNTQGQSAMAGMAAGASSGRSMAGLVSGELQSRIDANNAASARDTEAARLTAEQNEAMYGPNADVYVNGVKQPPTPGRLKAMADAEYSLQLARGAGYQNVRSAAEAGIYDKQKDWLVPLEMIIGGVGNAAGTLGRLKGLKGKGGK